MKFIIVFAALFAVAFARPEAPKAEVTVLRSESEVLTNGFKYAVETSDGSVQTAQGELKNAGTEQEAISVRGSFSFVGTDGTTYTINYVADENGFQPEGKHIPVAPTV